MNKMLSKKYHSYVQMYGETNQPRMLNGSKPVVIDTGSGLTKVGFAGDKAPRFSFPSVVAKKDNQFVVGEEALKIAGHNRPIAHGIVTNFDQWTAIVKHAYKLLGVNSEGSAVLFTEAPLNPKANREKMTTIAFEELKVANMYVAI